MYEVTRRFSPADKLESLKINNFLGLNISATSTQIDIAQSPDMLNLLPDDKGALDTRYGIRSLFESIGEGGVTGFFYFKHTSGDIYLFGHDDKLYTVDDVTEETTWTYTQISDAFSGNEIQAFPFNGKLYLKDGVSYFEYDGSTVSEVAGYGPTILIGIDPATGEGTDFDDLNMLTPEFKLEYSGDGSTKVYPVPYTDLDETEVTVDYNGSPLVEDTDFTVQRSATPNATVTFNTAPNDAAPNNVKITLYKTFSGYREKIEKCTIWYTWSGADGSRVWFAGNPDEPNTDYRSGLKRADYFPHSGIDELGGTETAIVGYRGLYNKLIIYKEGSSYVRESVTSSGTTTFIRSVLNDSNGAVARRSITVLDNYPTFVSADGVRQSISISEENERNVRLISKDINRNVDTQSIQGILDMGNLEDYIGIDYNRQLWLFNPNNGYVWVYAYDYLKDNVGQWYLLNGMYASHVLKVGDNLVFGDSRKGVLFKYLDKSSLDPYYDQDGETLTPIESYWTSKVINFGVSSNTKLVASIFVTVKPSTTSSVEVFVRSDRNSVFKSVKEIVQNLFSYATISYDTFSYGANSFPQTKKAKVKAKKINYYQVKVSSDTLYSSLGLLEVLFKAIVQESEVK